MPTPRRIVLAAALAAAAFAPPASAQDAPKTGGGTKPTPADNLTPEARYDAQRVPMLVQVGGKLESAATFAMGNKMKRTGLDLYKVIIEDYDANNARARRELGWDKKGEEWVANEKKQESLQEVEDESEKK